MFTIFQAKSHRTPLTKTESSYLFRKLGEYAKLPENGWIFSTNFQSLEWYWCSAMNTDNGVMGCANAQGGEIYLMQNPNGFFPLNSGFDPFWLDQLFHTAVHELRHIWQWKKSRLTYTVLSLPILREFTLEKDARKHQGGEEW